MKILLLGTNNNKLSEVAAYFNKMGKTVVVCNNMSKFKMFLEAKNPDCIIAFPETETRTAIADNLKLINSSLKLIILDDDAESVFSQFLVLPKNTNNQTLHNHLNNENKKLPTLLIEDNTFMLDYFSELLQIMGIEHHAVSTFDDALDQIQSKTFRLIISDMNIAGRVAPDLFDEYKKIHHSLPATIVISGNTEEEIKDRTNNFHADTFLLKPVTEELFTNSVSILLNLEVNKPTAGRITFSETYSVNEISKILKGDKTKLKTCIEDFIRVMDLSISSTDMVLNGGNYELVRLPHHDVLNLCSYFGAHKLNSLIIDFKKDGSKSTVLPSIQEEQKKVLEFLHSLNF